MVYKKRSIASFFSMTFLIIVITTLISTIGFIAFLINADYIKYLALTPSAIFQGQYLWTLLTHMFVHAGFFHLFANMFSLWFVGSIVEKIIGRKRFLWLYILSGIFAGAVSVVLSHFFGYGLLERIFMNPSTSMLGASGAIFALVGLLAVIIPRSKVYLIAGPLVAIIVQAVVDAAFPNASWLGVVGLLINVYIIYAIFAMLSPNPRTRAVSLPLAMPLWVLPVVAIVPLVVIGLFTPLPIGNIAHLAGLLFGVIYGIYLRKKYRKKMLVLGNYFRSY